MIRVLFLVALSTLDGFLTLREGGLEVEGNPAIRWLMGYPGWLWFFWGYKTLGVATWGWILERYRPILLWLVLALLVVVFGVHAVVVSWCEGCVLG